MKFTFSGILSIATGNTTGVLCLGQFGQNLQLPANCRVDIAPVLADKGVFSSDSVLVVPGKTILLVNYSPIFNRVEVVPMEGPDAQVFFLAAQSDPDVLKIMSEFSDSFKRSTTRFLAASEKLIPFLSDEGPTVALFQKLGEVNWKGAFQEILAALKQGFPERWDLISQFLSTNTIEAISKIK